jgi:hypothetical protein
MSENEASRAHKERRRAEEATQWAAKLLARYGAAASTEARAQALVELDLPYLLDQDAALALYQIDAALASPFIQRHLPPGRRAQDAQAPWERLMEQARVRADHELYFALYRRQAPAELWLHETSRLARSTTDGYVLSAELARRHPQRWRAQIGPHLAALAVQNGTAVLPYLLQHAGQVWSINRRSGYDQILDFTRAAGWWDLWATLIRVAATPAEYDREVAALASDRASSDADVMHRLLLLAGVSGEPGVRPLRGKPLREETILALYERFPHLVRGPYRNQLHPSVSRPLTGVLELAIRHKDDELIDALAARLAVRADRSGADRLLQAANYAARHLQTVDTDFERAERRAASILKRIPRHAIRSVRELKRRNALARLLFERAERACLHDSTDAAQLLQAEERHVCALAVQALTSEAPQAALRARENLDALLHALERPLPRAVIRRALTRLDSAVSGPAQATRVVEWARAKLPRHDSRYSEDAMLGLVARQLHRFPDLRSETEKPTVYRRAYDGSSQVPQRGSAGPFGEGQG